LLLATARTAAGGDAGLGDVAGLPIRCLSPGIPLYAAFLAPQGSESTFLSASESELSVLWRTEKDALQACAGANVCPEGFVLMVARLRVVSGAAAVVYGKGVAGAFAAVRDDVLGAPATPSRSVKRLPMGGAYRVRASASGAPLRCSDLFVPSSMRAALTAPDAWLLFQRLAAAGCHGFYGPLDGLALAAGRGRPRGAVGAADASAQASAASGPARRAFGTLPKGASPAQLKAGGGATEEARAAVQRPGKAKGRTARPPRVGDGDLDDADADAGPEARQGGAPRVSSGNAVLLAGAGRFVSLDRLRVGGLAPTLRRVVIYPVLVLGAARDRGPGDRPDADGPAAFGEAAVGADGPVVRELLAAVREDAAEGRLMTSPSEWAAAFAAAAASGRREDARARRMRDAPPSPKSRPVSAVSRRTDTDPEAARAGCSAIRLADRVVADLRADTPAAAAVTAALERRLASALVGVAALVHAAALAAGASAAVAELKRLVADAVPSPQPSSAGTTAVKAMASDASRAGAADGLISAEHLRDAVSPTAVRVQLYRAGEPLGDGDGAADVSVGAIIARSREPVVVARVSLLPDVILAAARVAAQKDADRGAARAKARESAAPSRKGRTKGTSKA